MDRNFELKSQIHRKLIGVLNLDRVSSIPKDRVRAEIGRVVERLLEEERVPMTTAEQTKIVEEVLDEVLGLGPLEPLLKEPSISDILVNRLQQSLHRAQRQALGDAGPFQGRRAPAAHHREDRFAGGPPHRRSAADRGRAPAPTARASTPSFRRWRSTARASASAVSAAT